MIDNRYTGCCSKNINSTIKRSDVINYLIDKYKYNKYLEIGVFDGNNFSKINCKLKHGVDPGAESVVAQEVTHKMTSDEFFINTNEKYDIIFIDGLHHYQQVVKDINNSLKHISDNGCILLHDCNPCDNLCQTVPRQSIVWNGDVWKAFVLFRKQNPNAECFVLDTDFGIGVIKYDKNIQTIASADIHISYEEFEENRSELLNLIKCDNYNDLGVL